MIDHVARFIIPAAFSLLPEVMRSQSAKAELLAIGLQESRFLHRRQLEGGPARGLWQFERGGGVRGVATHPKTEKILESVLRELRYESIVGDSRAMHYAIEDNDVLACVFARLLLWTVPGRLPGPTEHEAGWAQYLEGWRPGAPHPATWKAFYKEAWDRVIAEEMHR